MEVSARPSISSISSKCDLPPVITNAKVLTKIRRFLETRLAGIRVEHKEALGGQRLDPEGSCWKVPS